MSINVNVTGEEYIVCDEYSQKRWSNKKTGTFGGGILNTDDDPYRTERTGLLGEVAFAKLTGLPVDLGYHELGDECDFRFDNATLDVKTAAKLPKYRAGLIRVEGINGVEIELKSDLYVFGFVCCDNRKKKLGSVTFVGYQRRDWILEYGSVKPGKAGGWKNLEVPYEKMLPINDLICSIKCCIIPQR